MNKEEKEQWLYEEYKWTSNFDFNRLDKYEEANDDLCIDDLILDYTMLYEHYKKEIERLNNIIDKAIEILENKKHCEKLFGGVEGKTFTEEAIEILKGEDKE